MENRTKWLDKPYNNLNAFLRSKFGTKVIKLSVDGGFSCPNRDGTLGTGGCIFCSESGSGEFSGDRQQTITEQIESQIDLLKEKWPTAKYMVYFQSYSNTYGDIAHMEAQFREALSYPDVVGLAIATRVDCIDEDVLTLLSTLNKETYIWVELGLQSIMTEHHQLLNTGYTATQFSETAERLASHEIDVVGHVILGLPDSPGTLLEETINFLNDVPIKGLKIHMLNILEQTALATLYEKNPFQLLEMEAYLGQVIRIVEHLRQDIVIHRVTGDGAKEQLIGPRWILNKRKVLNTLMKQFKLQESYQGKYYEGAGGKK